MAKAKVRFSELNRISAGVRRFHAYRVLLFDLYADSPSDIVLDKYRQVPLDITPYVVSCNITESHDGEANTASFTINTSKIDWRLFLYSWVKVYHGDVRVPTSQWPIEFSGFFRGQPGRSFKRGDATNLTQTAFDRSVWFREQRTTLRRSWQPGDADANLGDICVYIATSTEDGMGLQRDEVLFGKFYDEQGNPYRINKKTQISDESFWESLRLLMFPARLEPAFNSEGKLVARSTRLSKPPTRIWSNGSNIISQEMASNTSSVVSSVTVVGLDHRVSRAESPFQVLSKVENMAVGPFIDRYRSEHDWGEDRKQRARLPAPSEGFGDVVQKLETKGQLLSHIFALDSRIDAVVTEKDEFTGIIEVRFHGVVLAIVVLTLTLGAYIYLKLLAASIGTKGPFNSAAAFMVELTATLLLQVVMQMMTAIGHVSFEIWGIPFEEVYKEIRVTYRLTDLFVYEEQDETIENFILGDKEEVAAIALEELERHVAQTAQRTLTVPHDFVLEPGDTVSVEENGTTSRYYIDQVSYQVSRGQANPMNLTGYRIA